MSGVRKNFDKQFNLSSGVLDLIMKSWSEGTTKQYVPHLRRWFSFCSENGLQPLNADVSSGAEFLTQYFRKSSCEYSSVNTSILPAVNRFTFGEQPLTNRILRGMFKERPTFRRYTVTYDVKYVLDYVKKGSVSSETSLELASKMLATMMCLLSGQRSQTLVSSSTDCIYLRLYVIQGVSFTYQSYKNIHVQNLISS